jgi:hypothetical protein
LRGEESAAIIEGERQGKPHPFPEKEAQRAGSATWYERQIHEAEERESSKVVQIGYWPDNKRAMPTDFLACALFAALHGKIRSSYVANTSPASTGAQSPTPGSD